MRFLLVLAFVALAYAGTALPKDNSALRAEYSHMDQEVFDLLMANNGEIELAEDDEEGLEEVAPQFIISWAARKKLRALRRQMACGWPDQGIPPLAPLKLREGEFNMQKGLVETLNRIFRFRVDGLDQFKMKTLKLNIIKKKITFNFLFSKIRASADKYETDTLLDALREMGVSVRYEGDGVLDFSVLGLRLEGEIKYKMGTLWGSARITSLKTKVSLDRCQSQVTGFLGEGPFNKMVNQQVELFCEKAINDNTQAISDTIEDTLKPKINQQLKGNDIWSLIDSIFGGGGDSGEEDYDSAEEAAKSKCKPPKDPWA